MNFTDNETATYLFCAALPETKTKPLTIIEWNTVVLALGKEKLQPNALIQMTTNDLDQLLKETTLAQKQRIMTKISSRMKLGLSLIELENIKNQGYHILFRSKMPARLKKKLPKKYLPAFYYGAGNLNILSYPALGVVGARDATPEELEKTAQIGKEAAEKGIVIISGGAKGVDTTAVDAALENNGKAVVFPADGLEHWIKKQQTREYIANEQLLLLSTQPLPARFAGHYAMQRNKFIHATADAVLVASSQISGTKKSGTWEGVIENLEMNLSPLYVIGESEGVKQLLAQQHVQTFPSLDEVFSVVEQEIAKQQFPIQLAKLIQHVHEKGITKEQIEANIIQVLEHCFPGNKQADSTEIYLKPVKVEQMSFDSFVNENNK